MSSKIEKIRKSSMIWVLIWSVFFGVIAFVLLVALTSERRTDSGEIMEDVAVKSVTCEGEGAPYPFFTFDSSLSKNLKIVATVDQDKLKTISLQYFLHYDDAELITESESENHAAMNMEFAKNGLSADAIGATYAKLADGLRFGIYRDGKEMKEEEKQFFLLGGANEYSTDKLVSVYNEAGLNCEISE